MILVHGIIITKNIIEEDNQSFVAVSVRLKTGKKVLIKVPYKPCFFVKEKDAKNLKIDYESTSLKNFSDDSVVKLEFKTVNEMRNYETQLMQAKIECYESDVNITQMFSNNLDLGSILDYENEKINPMMSRCSFLRIIYSPIFRYRF